MAYNEQLMTGVIHPAKGRHSLWTTWQVYFRLGHRTEKCNWRRDYWCHWREMT
jgi:hypothetical protein